MKSETLEAGSERWHQLRERAQTDLYWLADVALGYGKLVPMTRRAHTLMCAFASRKTGVSALDEARVRLVLVPRLVGKSTLITQALALQWALKDHQTAVLIGNETERGASKFLAEIKRQIETNELLRALFPELLPEPGSTKWSETEATVKRLTSRKEPTFMAVGEGAAITGLHPIKVILDDLISDEAMENARSGVWTLMEKAKRWIDRLRPIVDTGGDWEIIAIGTRWWENDIYDHLEQTFGYGEKPRQFELSCQVEENATLSVTAQRRGDLAIFKRSILENGTSYFPARWSDEALAKLRVADPVLFSANLMNDPKAPEVTTFKPGWRRYFEWASGDIVSYLDAGLVRREIPVSDLDCLMSIDPAFTESGTGARQAVVVTGSSERGERLLLEPRATRLTIDAYIRSIVDLARRYRPRKALIEKAGQQAAFIRDIKIAFDAAGLQIPVEEVSPGGRNKDVRIATLEWHFARGLIYVRREEQDFWNEYDAFPRGKYKDLLDALAYQVPHWRRSNAEGAERPSEVARRENELKGLYQRMGKRPPATLPGGKDQSRFRQDGTRRW